MITVSELQKSCSFFVGVLAVFLYKSVSDKHNMNIFDRYFKG